MNGKQTQAAESESLDALLGRLQGEAKRLGFDLLGVAPAVTPAGFHRLVQWIDQGHAAGMRFFADRLAAYADPGMVLAGARTLIVLSYPYPGGDVAPPDRGAAPAGRVARYAWPGADYHDVIHPKLKRLGESIRRARPDARVRGVVDTAPLMEREFASLAGLGWAGKNSLLLNQWRGSYFFLACLLTSLPLPASQPQPSGHCGTCTRCLDACPTDAFPAPGVVDSRRCISYLTIEHRGPIPEPLRFGIGDWLFGCDVCQEVCPWNQRASRRRDAAAEPLPAAESPRQDRLDLVELLSLDEAGFRARFRHTPLWRPRRRGLLRNAAIVAGNLRASPAVPVLLQRLADPESLVRGAAAWALGRIGGQAAELTARLQLEADDLVRAELIAALEPPPGDPQAGGQSQR